MAALVEVLGGVSMRRAIATADVAAHETKPQVDPVRPDLEALLAPFKCVRRNGLGDLIKVPALTCAIPGSGRHVQLL